MNHIFFFITLAKGRIHTHLVTENDQQANDSNPMSLHISIVVLLYSTCYISTEDFNITIIVLLNDLIRVRLTNINTT